MSLSDISKTRKLKMSTIIGHVEELYIQDAIDLPMIQRAVSPAFLRVFPKIAAAFKRHGTQTLTPVYQELKGVYSFDELRLARVLYQA